VVTVDVNVTDAGHGYATPTAADATKLTSATSGPARILYKPAGTGTLRCVVKLDEAGSGGSLTAGSDRLSSDFTISSSNVSVDTGHSITLPSAGSYILFAQVTAIGTCSALDGAGQDIVAVLRDDTAGAFIGERAVMVSPVVTGYPHYGTGTIILNYTVASSRDISLYVSRENGGFTAWTTSLIQSIGTNVGYLKYA
jgi:hypothetical protein